MLSRYFVTRPVLACVLAAFLVLAGSLALLKLPLAELPPILPPQVTVQANYPGASPQVLADTVAAPLEQQLTGLENLLYMSSVTASDGLLNITLNFEVGTNLDVAAINVNNRIQVALSRLPEEVRRQSVTVSKNSSAVLMYLTFQTTDESMPVLELSNFVTRNVVDDVRRIPGVAAAVNTSNRHYSLRIWLDPGKLAQLNLSASDVAEAVREQNSQYTAGALGEAPAANETPMRLAVITDGRYSTPEQFGNIVLRVSDGGAIVRLRDVARIEVGAQRYDFDAKLNGRVMVPVAIRLTPDANAIAVSKAVRTRVDELARRFPANITYSVPFDTSGYVQQSIHEVLLSLIEAFILVLLVVWLFLGRWRATLIPMVAAPVSLIGTLAVMQLLGMSINILTLLAMVLATGIVVDDAIVVLENVERIMHDEGLSVRAATERAMQQVTRPVIAIVLALVAVFLPVGFLGGLSGVLYQQFALTLSAAVCISGWVALTLTPALCVLLLNDQALTPPVFVQRFKRHVDRYSDHQSTLASALAARPMVALSILLCVIGLTVLLYRAVPPALVPYEDKGYVMSVINLPDGATLNRTTEATQQATARFLQHPGVENLVSFIGYDTFTGSMRSNSAILWIMLKDWRERRDADLSQSAIAQALNQVGKQLNDGRMVAFEPPAITGLSNTGGFDAYIQARGTQDLKQLETVVHQFLDAAQKRPELSDVYTTYSASVPQLYLSVDRDKAKLMNVSLSEVFTALQSTFGAYYINDFNLNGRIHQVQMQAEERYRARPENIRDVYVKNARGQLLPLTTLATVREVIGTEHLQRFNGLLAAGINGNAAHGYSSGAALRALEEVAAQSLPPGYTLAWSGAYLQQKNDADSKLVVLWLGVLMVFLIMAAQFENWTLPLAILLTLPFAMFGALCAAWLRGMPNEIYMQIGMLTLIGLSAKNAVLIVEFANQKVSEGMAPVAAALAAAKLRMRPILMTSMAFLFGVLPLAFSRGAGAGSRQALASGVIGGMVMATFVATLFVPVFYGWLKRR